MVSIAGCGSSGSGGGAASATSAARTACDALAEGSSLSLAECAQGYEAEKAGRSEQASCDHVGAGAVATLENVGDCQVGWGAAPVSRKVAVRSASAGAQSACRSIAQGGSASIAACAQGYGAVKAGVSEEESCDHLDSGAVTTMENVKDCQDGWSEG
jgi:hypothetical protein